MLKGIQIDDEIEDELFCERLAEKPLERHKGLNRLRVSDYRIIYSVDNGELIVYVVDAGNRGDIYKRYK